MAAFVAEGKRITRRGEIGLTSNEIEKYEDVRNRKQTIKTPSKICTKCNHLFTGWLCQVWFKTYVEEWKLYEFVKKIKFILLMKNVPFWQKAFAMFSKEERQKRENEILSQLRDVVQKKISRKKKFKNGYFLIILMIIISMRRYIFIF
jgi:hypothetical protein